MRHRPHEHYLRSNRTLRAAVIATAFLAAMLTVGTATASPSLSDDDVSWLFPAPHSQADLANLIAIKNLGGTNSVWSPAAFQSFVSIADGSDSKIQEKGPDSKESVFQISLPPDARKIDAWYVAGVRFDAGAPGLSREIGAQFGRLPEIRLILQPITVTGGTVQVHDYAAHLIFDFVTGGEAPAQSRCLSRQTPDTAAFQSIVDDLIRIKNKLATGGFAGTQIPTSGLPLGVHPGLANSTTAGAVSQEMEAILQKYLPSGRLDAMAVVGVPAAAAKPWIFVSMLNTPAGFVAISSPTLDGQQKAISLNPRGSNPRVVPMPVTNNGVVATCRSAELGTAALPIAMRHGLSTADIFAKSSPSPDEVRAVTATIADPVRSHFFNTDCVSCHTETRLVLRQGDHVDGVDPKVLPSGDWVVRNFGWAPSSDGAQATATRRTEAETHAIVEFLNATPPQQ